MGTYTYEKLMLEYANDRVTAEMALGHSLQHIGKLYEAQKAANLSRHKMRGKIDSLENAVNVLQKEVARRTALVEKMLPGHKRKSSGKQQKSQP